MSILGGFVRLNSFGVSLIVRSCQWLLGGDILRIDFTKDHQQDWLRLSMIE